MGTPSGKPILSQEIIFGQLTTIFRDLFEDDSIVLTPGTTANDIADWDSMNHVSLIVEVEGHFHIKFQDAETEELKNVGDFVALIQEKTGTQGS